MLFSLISVGALLGEKKCVTYLLQQAEIENAEDLAFSLEFNKRRRR